MKKLNQTTKKEFWLHIKKGSEKNSYAYDLAVRELSKFEKNYCDTCGKEIKKGLEFCSDKCEEEYKL